MFNVIITSPNEWTDYDKLKSTCDHLLSRKINSGEKINIILDEQDSLARIYANEKSYGTMFIPIDWRLGKKARIVRNMQLAEISNACIAFFSSYSSNYQQHTLLDACRKHNVSIRKIEEDAENN
jgi:histidinol phosphatase-like PHP family hydrolase